MTYTIRDRQDGMVEIVFSSPILIGIFPERETAEKVCAYMQTDEGELPLPEAAGFGRAQKDVEEAASIDLDAVEAETAPPVRKARARTRNLPAVVKDKPQMPVQMTQVDAVELTDAQQQQAFARIQQGEKIYDVARDFGLTMGQLRGKWANHKRNLQKHLAEGGQQPCSLCAHPFTPSISNPDTCARCSK